MSQCSDRLIGVFGAVLGNVPGDDAVWYRIVATGLKETELSDPSRRSAMPYHQAGYRHMYRFGCASADDETMWKAYHHAADQGDPEAQVSPSELYVEGRGTPQNAHHAYMWGRLAERRLPPGQLRSSAGGPSQPRPG